MARNPRSTQAYRRLRDRVIAEETDCCICDQPVDKNLRWPHPGSPSIEHKDKLADGGTAVPLDRSRVGLAHLGCNSSEGAAFGNRRRATPLVTSRPW